MEEMEELLDASLALEPSNILHDLIDVLGSDAIDLWHIAKFPMVRLDAVGRSPLEGGIAMVVRLIDLMDQWRSVVGARRLLPVAGSTVSIECGFAYLELSRHRTASSRWLGLRGIASHEEAQHQEPYADLRS